MPKIDIVRDKIEESKFIIHIENKKPIELDDLSTSMRAMANLYNRFNKANPISNESKDAKLYVTKISEGSIVIELQDVLFPTIIPFIENANSIVEFAKHIKGLINKFSTSKPSTDEYVSIDDCKDIGEIITPVAKDNASQSNYSAVVNGNVILNIELNSKQSKEILENTKSFIIDSKKTEIIDDVVTRVLLSMYQVRNTQNSKVGNKGIIEDISDKPMNISFVSDDLQKEMLSTEINPLTTIFEVDIKIKTVNGTIKAYQIQKIHQIFEDE